MEIATTEVNQSREEPTGVISTSAPASTNSARQILANRAVTRRTCLNLPPKIPLEDWRQLGNEIFVLAESSTWWLGDWLIYGQSQYPDLYARAIEKTSLDYQTLRNYAWVARRYSIPRRRPGLSFQHHAELTSMLEKEQEEWLDRAERFKWSRNELRNRVRANRKSLEQAEGDNPKSTVDEARVNIELKVPSDHKDRWMEAASSEQQDLLSWMVAILDNAAASVPATADKPAAAD